MKKKKKQNIGITEHFLSAVFLFILNFAQSYISYQRPAENEFFSTGSSL